MPDFDQGDNAHDPTTPVPGAQTPEDAEYEKAKGHIEKYLGGHPAWKYACDQVAAVAAPPAMPPAAPGAPPPMPGKPETPAEKMARQEQAQRYESRIATLERENRAIKYRAELTDLSINGGVLLDVEKTLQKCQDMTAEQFAERLDEIATHYRRDPAGIPHVPVLGGTVGKDLPEDAITEKHSEAALKYMRSKGCDFDEAIEATRPGKRTPATVK